MRRRGWIPALLVIAALPMVADRLRSGSEQCVLDGVEAGKSFRVEVVAADGTTRSFCGVRCADLWLERQEVAPQAIRVTDCASGRKIDARDAWFVRSVAVRGEGAPDLIRVFASREDAVRHAEAYRGRILAPPPFRRYVQAGEGHAFPGQ